jgi:hypothetical protein
MTTIPFARRAAILALLGTATSPLLAGCASARPAALPGGSAPGVTTAAASPAAESDAFSRTVPTPDAHPGEEPAWTYHALAFLWVPGIKGKAGKGDAVGKPDVSVSDTADVLKNTLERALLTHVEARTDGWGLFGEIIALKLEDDESETKVFGPVKLPNGKVVAPRRTARLETEATLEMALVEAGATLDLTGDLVAEERTDARIEALVGARYYDVELDLEFNDRRLSGEGNDWIDGFVGARASVLIDDKWDVVLRGDIGGGGVGTSSDVAWRATGMVRYHAWERVSLFAGWHTLDVDNERGSGASKQVFDLRLSGPILGFTYDF